MRNFLLDMADDFIDGVLRLDFFQNGDTGVGGFPEGEEKLGWTIQPWR